MNNKPTVVKRPDYIGWLRKRGVAGRIFREGQDALVRVYHIQHLGYVAIVTYPFRKDDCRFFFGETDDAAVGVAIRDLGLKLMFEPDRGDILFRMPYELVRKYSQVAAEITYESGELHEYRRATEERNRDIDEILDRGGKECDALPLSFYLDNMHDLIHITGVKLSPTQPDKSHEFGRPTGEALRSLETLEAKLAVVR